MQLAYESCFIFPLLNQRVREITRTTTTSSDLPLLCLTLITQFYLNNFSSLFLVEIDS